jgi:NCAIR mutase (PurE)-related protein
VRRLYDVGVAGIHRLLRNQHVLHESQVAICVAGMDGALPGVVVRINLLNCNDIVLVFNITLILSNQGGLTTIPVIAVPTSIG